jgi:hypothetical protein
VGPEGQARDSMMVRAERNHILAILDELFGTNALDVMRFDEYPMTKKLGAFPSANRARIATLAPELTSFSCGGRFSDFISKRSLIP